MSTRNQLADLIKANALTFGDFTLSSGQKSDFYIDLRKVTLSGIGSFLVGETLLDLLGDLEFDAVGGLTLGADPVAMAMVAAAHRRGVSIDAFVVRKKEKSHGMKSRIEGPSVENSKVLVLEDTSTTGQSALEAISALRDQGAEVISVAMIVNRGGLKKIKEAGFDCRAIFEIQDLLDH
jgi:orotate phosphoribosyltransferase